MSVERCVVDWDGDRSELPAIPADDSCQKDVLEFNAKMGSFVDSWNPAAPEGVGWVLVEKKWVCTELCGKCGVEASPETGSCVLQGVRPRSVWERPGT